jgi:4-aminobutyrate aminotransferase-like enzyme
VARVAITGARLLTALRALANEDPQVGAVRGWGLAVAVDIVDPATGRPDPGRTASTVEAMRERGVLIGRTGRERATLKIRPPLNFGDEHADLLIEALTNSLRAGH